LKPIYQNVLVNVSKSMLAVKLSWHLQSWTGGSGGVNIG